MWKWLGVMTMAAGLGFAAVSAQPPPNAPELSELDTRMQALRESVDLEAHAIRGIADQAERALTLARELEGAERERALRIADAALGLVEEVGRVAEQEERLEQARRLLMETEERTSLAQERAEIAEAALRAWRQAVETGR